MTDNNGTINLPAPNDGMHPLDEVVQLLTTYMDMPVEAMVACALWAAHTYRVEDFDHTSILHVSAVTEESGKTRLGSDLIGNLVANPEHFAFTSPASLRRTLLRLQHEGKKPTFIMDEADELLKTRDDLTGLLNYGVSRSGPIPLSMPTDDGGWEVVKIDAYCPKILIGIGDLPAKTLASRTIPIRLSRRTANGERLPRLRANTITEVIQPLGARLGEWAKSVELPRPDALARDYVSPELSDRQADLWEPLLMMADTAGGDWGARAREAAISLHARSKKYSVNEALLRDIKTVFVDLGDPDTVSSDELCEKLTESEDFGWGNYRSATGLSSTPSRWPAFCGKWALESLSE